MEQHGNTAPFVWAQDISSVCFSPRMPLLAPRSINRVLLTLEAGGEITSSPAGLLGWIFMVSHAFALAAEVTYAARTQPCAGL